MPIGWCSVVGENTLPVLIKQRERNVSAGKPALRWQAVAALTVCRDIKPLGA